MDGRGSTDKTFITGASGGFKALRPWSAGGSGPLYPPASQPKKSSSSWWKTEENDVPGSSPLALIRTPFVLLVVASM